MAEAPQWHRTPERGGAALIGFAGWLAGVAPGWVTGPLLRLVALYFTVLPSRTSAAGTAAYLTRVLGRPPRISERYRQVLAFTEVVFDRIGLLAGDPGRFTIRASGEEAVIRAHAAGRGGVLLGAHFGSFEALRAFDRQLPGLVVRYLMFQQHAEATARTAARLNPQVAARVIALTDGPGAMLAVREALARGEFVAFLGDRMPVENPRAAVEARFLGGAVRLPRAPYLAAMLAGVPLILCFAPRVGPKTYDIEFSEIYDGAQVARGERDAKCGELAQRYADHLAEMCRRHPYNWFNFFDFWG